MVTNCGVVAEVATEAVHGQPSNVVTFTLPLPPSTPGVAAAALNAYVHVAWLSLNCLPTTLRPPMRAAPLVFGSTEYETEPLPKCTKPSGTCAHEARLLAPHPHVSPVMTPTLLLPPSGANDAPSGLSSAYEHGLWLILKVLPAIVSVVPRCRGPV